MATMTIRNIDDQLKVKLRLQAARHNRSMEEEARDILRAALSMEADGSTPLVTLMRSRIEPLGGVELEVPEREPTREPVVFDA